MLTRYAWEATVDLLVAMSVLWALLLMSVLGLGERRREVASNYTSPSKLDKTAYVVNAPVCLT